jgi:hypothetical protein
VRRVFRKPPIGRVGAPRNDPMRSHPHCVARASWLDRRDKALAHPAVDGDGVDAELLGSFSDAEQPVALWRVCVMRQCSRRPRHAKTPAPRRGTGVVAAFGANG